MRSSDWSSDVCSSDLRRQPVLQHGVQLAEPLQRLVGQQQREYEGEQRAGIAVAADHLVAAVEDDGGEGETAQRLHHGMDDVADPRRFLVKAEDRKSTCLNSSHYCATRMPSSA